MWTRRARIGYIFSPFPREKREREEMIIERIVDARAKFKLFLTAWLFSDMCG